jgi:hypothetical protein
MGLSGQQELWFCPRRRLRCSMRTLCVLDAANKPEATVGDRCGAAKGQSGAGRQMLVRGDVVEGQDIAADEKGVWCPPTSGSSDGYVMRSRWVELEVDAVMMMTNGEVGLRRGSSGLPAYLRRQRMTCALNIWIKAWEDRDCNSPTGLLKIEAVQ